MDDVREFANAVIDRYLGHYAVIDRYLGHYSKYESSWCASILLFVIDIKLTMGVNAFDFFFSCLFVVEAIIVHFVVFAALIFVLF